MNPTGHSVTFAPHQEHLEEEQTVCMEDNGPLGETDEEEDQLSDTLFMINEYRDEKDTTPPSCSVRSQDDDKVEGEVEIVVFTPWGCSEGR